MIKDIVRKLDKKMLGGSIQDLVFSRKMARLQKRFVENYPYKEEIFYSSSPPNPISRLCDKYGSDKGSLQHSSNSYKWHAHTYADVYFDLFAHCRLSIKSVFECGLGTNKEGFNSNMGISGKPGASLRVWRDFFPNAEVIGADIDRDILFGEDRIRTFYVDQTDQAEIHKMWKDVGGKKFDVMIDDGLHTFEAGKCLLENSIDQLSDSGIYVIEDVRLEDFIHYRPYFAKSKLPVKFINLQRPGIRLDDNSMIIIRKTLVT